MLDTEQNNGELRRKYKFGVSPRLLYGLEDQSSSVLFFII